MPVTADRAEVDNAVVIVSGFTAIERIGCGG
jgi:hypothetical protein